MNTRDLVLVQVLQRKVISCSRTCWVLKYKNYYFHSQYLFWMTVISQLLCRMTVRFWDLYNTFIFLYILSRLRFHPLTDKMLVYLFWIPGKDYCQCRKSFRKRIFMTAANKSAWMFSTQQNYSGPEQQQPLDLFLTMSDPKWAKHVVYNRTRVQRRRATLLCSMHPRLVEDYCAVR